MFSLVSGMDVQQTQETIGFNTDSMVDMMTGDFARDKDGKFACRGGFGPALSGTLGRPNQYKSTFMASLAMRICSLYQTELTIFDSEDSISRNKERILRMAGDRAGILSEDNVISLDAKNHYDLESMRDLIEEIGNKKKEMGKKAKFTTPFFDKDGNRVSVWVPTVILIDSWSECASTAEKDKIANKGIDDAGANTIYMLDANKKTMVSRNLSRYASEYGIEILTTAHYGPKMQMDPYAPNPKILPWASNTEAPKGVGSKYLFLTNPQFLINSCAKLQDDQRQCKYKMGEATNPTDLNEIMVSVQRCKNNASGIVHPFIVSQESGLLTECTDYAYLRNVGKGFSMTGNNMTHQPFAMKDVNLTRNTFRQICSEDHRVVRALQFGAQWLYVMNNWNLIGYPFPIKVDPMKVVDMLLSDKNPYTVDRVMNSRGYWLPDELITKETPEYFSIFDILELFSKCGMLESK